MSAIVVFKHIAVMEISEDTQHIPNRCFQLIPLTRRLFTFQYHQGYQGYHLRTGRVVRVIGAMVLTFEQGIEEQRQMVGGPRVQIHAVFQCLFQPRCINTKTERESHSRTLVFRVSQQLIVACHAYTHNTHTHTWSPVMHTHITHTERASERVCMCVYERKRRVLLFLKSSVASKCI